MANNPKILVLGVTGQVGNLANGVAVKPDEVFDNLPSIIGRQPRTLADFAKKHADVFRY
jgi:hypothetical protein